MSGVDDYVIGFKIFEAKSLKTEDGGPCDPFVLVECCGYEFRTATQENKVTKSLVLWNEGYIWPDIQLHPKQFESATIDFSVYSRYWFGRNYLIGKATMQLAFINNRPRHLYARTWMQLKRDGPSPTGELNISVYALKPGQQAPSATEQNEAANEKNGQDGADSEDIDDLSKHVLRAMPEAPAGRQYHLRIIISRVEDLNDLPGGGGAPSPFVTVEFAGCLVQTARGEAVNQFTFNEEIVIPVTSPVYEDLVAVKLWTAGGFFSSDELIAQGNLSFRGMRNAAMPPRWFNLYGWNEEEIPDPAALIEAGVRLRPNYFKGRLLLSGLVELLPEDEELQPASHVPARPVPDPGTMQLALLADVYMVTGAEGRRCRVEVSFGAVGNFTKMVDYDTTSLAMEEEQKVALPAPTNDDDEDTTQALETIEEVNTFSFKEKDGRIDPILAMNPEDPDSQPRVLINVYTEGRFRSEHRIGYIMCSLGQFPMYDHGSPAKPGFLAMEPMPDCAVNRTAPSVLISIERHNSDNVQRHNRRMIRPMVYIVRSYCFLARKIDHEGMTQDAEPSHYGLRVSCTGISRTTEMLQGPRPMWMQHMDMRVILCSDSVQEAPTIEPMTVTLVEQGMFGSDLGQAVCVYSHLRRKDNLGRWNPYKLEPQWIEIKEPNGGRVVGEVLIAFELLLWKHREEQALQPKDMWPQEEASFDPKTHLCRLKKATLHFSLHGLRDVAMLPNLQTLGSFVSGSRHVSKPMVTVEVNQFFRPEQELLSEDSKCLTFKYRDTKPGADRKIQANNYFQWRSKLDGEGEGSNFEFLQVGKMPILIPDKMILQPYLRIKVWESPPEDCGVVYQALGYNDPTPVGESLQSLAGRLPCCWLEDVELDKPYEEQRDLITERLKQARLESEVRPAFKQATEEELKKDQEAADASQAPVCLKVNIFSATGIGSATTASPYCTCEIRGKSGTRIKTKIGVLHSIVIWDHESVIANFVQGDILFFRIRDKDKPSGQSVIGSVSLASDRFFNTAFEGDLDLKGPLGGSMSLKVKVQVVHATSQKKGRPMDLVLAPEDKGDFVNEQALPEFLRAKNMPKRKLVLGGASIRNMEAEKPFSPRRGPPARGEESGRKTIHGKLENCRDRKMFVHDFWYKSMPLLRNHDVISPNDQKIDWNFLPDKTFGFVKCTYKLTHGWEEDNDEEGVTKALSLECQEEPTASITLEDEVEEVPLESDRTRLMRSFDFDPELNSYAFEQSLLEDKYKGIEMPSRVRVRIYLVKAVCIFGKPSGFADPYIEFQLGRYINVSMKNMMKPQTNTPEFYHIEERDIQLPVDSRLEVRVMDFDETANTVIGSTVIDLEDRWHSRAWRKINEMQQTPMENRPLYTAEIPGKNRGALEMWIEMVDSTMAGDVQAADIRKPAEIEVEVRFVIWGTNAVKCYKEDYTNVRISTKMDCQQYHGEHPETQATDIHYNCQDGNAVFNWRVVYNKIQMPTMACSVQFSLYHAESFGDEPIGMLDFNLQEYLAGVAKDLNAKVVGPGDLAFTSIDDEEDVGSVSITLYVMTQLEGTAKRQGLGQSEPNDDPQLLIPIAGREWGDYLGTWAFPWPDFGILKKLLPVIVGAFAFLILLVIFRKTGLL